MNDEAGIVFSGEEKDVLQEIMNIAFGNAAADLAEVVDIYVLLSVPSIHIINIGTLPTYMESALKSDVDSDIIEQKFWGEFKGSGVLVFPSGAGRDLISVFEGKGVENDEENGAVEIFEQGGMQEIGNILIGACVGKVSELLDTFVTYSPPKIFEGDTRDPNCLVDHFDPLQAAIVMKTVFTFQDKNISGFLLILTSHESIGWLKKALNRFLEHYE